MSMVHGVFFCFRQPSISGGKTWGIEPETAGAHLLLILVVTAAYIIIPWQAASILKATRPKMVMESWETSWAMKETRVV